MRWILIPAKKVHSTYLEKKQGETSSSNYFAAFVFEAAAQTSKVSLIFENLLQNIERQTFYWALYACESGPFCCTSANVLCPSMSSAFHVMMVRKGIEWRKSGDGWCNRWGAREAAEYCARIQQDMTKLQGTIDALKGYVVKCVTLKVGHWLSEICMVHASWPVMCSNANMHTCRCMCMYVCISV